eukprot:CAMPEP_0113721622 /NCGR_PEP_ID=MMETSP0038_2-20120614/37250_1 /TAXON_ID=2898 /ORGANISM="Cryptomonas paramecium" /LENGTH=73 /DNA_ID=CAMNT_0000650681 /DNA_START=54 /DNA_END=271 /DNA_ORIENTATION=+ /assembly_acc=CAM_ASM_000170
MTLNRAATWLTRFSHSEDHPSFTPKPDYLARRPHAPMKSPRSQHIQVTPRAKAPHHTADVACDAFAIHRLVRE